MTKDEQKEYLQKFVASQGTQAGLAISKLLDSIIDSIGGGDSGIVVENNTIIINKGTENERRVVVYQLINDTENGVQIAQIKVDTEEISIFDKDGEAFLYVNSTDYYFGKTDRTFVVSSNARPKIQIQGDPDEKEIAYLTDIVLPNDRRVLQISPTSWVSQNSIFQYTVIDESIKSDSMVVINFPNIENITTLDSAGFKHSSITYNNGSFVVYCETRPGALVTMSYKLLQ